jgi:hypothetical protein
MNTIPSYFCAAVLLFCCSAQAQDVEPGCETIDNVQGICGFPAPEDIDVFPGKQFLLFSPVTGINGLGLERLYTFNIDTLKASPITYQQSESMELWGDPSCTTAAGEDFSPHGVHISKRNDGRWQVLVVNHAREAVEIYEVFGGDKPTLSWRGCAMAPPKSNLNDVVALPEGGFLVSHMFDHGTMEVMEAMQSTTNTGYVLRWLPESGFQKLPGSDSIVPNGLALTEDGQSLFISETGGQRIRKINYLTGELEGQVALGPVDNLSWSNDGSLIATRITGAMPDDCFTKPGPCLTSFQVVSINPDTLEYTILHDQIGKPMGTASVAVVLGNYIYIGSFKGHQILRVAR